MADLFGGQVIDTNDIDDSEALPPGEYPARITGSEVKATKAGTGTMLILEIQIEDGEYKGRKFWESLNIQNQNVPAQQIGQRMLKKIVHATGAPPQISDSEVLHNLPFIAVTKVQEDDFGKKTALKNAKPFENPTGPQQNAAPAGGGQSQPTQQPASQPQNGGGMPWQK